MILNGFHAKKFRRPIKPNCFRSLHPRELPTHNDISAHLGGGGETRSIDISHVPGQLRQTSDKKGKAYPQCNCMRIHNT